MANETDTHDVVDGIVDDVFDLYPGIEVNGLPITGRVMRLARYLEALREQWLGEFGLTVPDFDVLATMRRTAGNAAINVRELQRSMMLSSGGTTKRLDRLEHAGLIERLPDPNDRRGVLIRLTPAGIELIDQAIPAITAHENEVVGNAIPSTRRRDQVADGLRRLLLDRERAESEDL